MNPVVDSNVITGMATSIAFLLTALFKMGWPAASTRSIVIAAVCNGILSAFLVTWSLAMSFTGPRIAITILGGLLAAGAAAGIRSTDASADDKRTNES